MLEQIDSREGAKVLCSKQPPGRVEPPGGPRESAKGACDLKGPEAGRPPARSGRSVRRVLETAVRFHRACALRAFARAARSLDRAAPLLAGNRLSRFRANSSSQRAGPSQPSVPVFLLTCGRSASSGPPS